MTNILYHRPTNREEAVVVEGSINGVSATSSDENVERSSEAVTETMDGSEARAALLSVIRTNCFACAVSDDDVDEDEKEEKEGLLGKEIQQSNLGNSSTGVSGWVRRGEKAKKKEVLDLGDTSTKPNWWQNILGASWSGSVSDVQKKVVLDSGETSSNKINSRLHIRPNPSSGGVSDVQKKVVLDSGETSSNKPNSKLHIRPNSRLSNPPNHLNGELVAAGWPSWLCAAGEAIYGWTPRRLDSFKKLDKIGQGLRSNVYKARDLMTGKIVAVKCVRFDNLDSESVKFIAREILVLRRLDHPNVMKLEGLVTSKMSRSLYLVFEYMEHDLAGLAKNPQIKFTEPQVKCYMQQLFLGLEYCHSHGVLHGDINGSNLLINSGGILKIAGFGTASFFDPSRKLPMTRRVTTLCYRPPELLMGPNDYGVGVDLWSMGRVLAELLAGKPIFPGRTEVEQLHKMFKLCGSPSEEYWKKSKLPHATIFKPQQPYKRCIAETFKDFPQSSLPLIETLLAIDPAERQTATAALMSEFFTTKPYACEPSSLPQYPPSKEMDAKLRDEEARRLRAAAKANGDGVKKTHVRDRPIRAMPAPEANAELQANLDRRRLITHAYAAYAKSKSEKFPPPHQDGALAFPLLGSSHPLNTGRWKLA